MDGWLMELSLVSCHFSLEDLRMTIIFHFMTCFNLKASSPLSTSNIQWLQTFAFFFLCSSLLMIQWLWKPAILNDADLISAIN